MKKIIAIICDFIKRVLHIGRKELIEAAADMQEQLEQELVEIGKQIEAATGEELERLRARAAVIHSELLNKASENVKEMLEELARH